MEKLQFRLTRRGKNTSFVIFRHLDHKKDRLTMEDDVRTQGKESAEIVRAGLDDERAIIPLMVAFNDAEGIPWRPKTMVPALRHLLGDAALGLVLLARDRVSRAVVGYGVVTFGFDLEFSGADAFVTELFVDSASRGRGIGRDLLDSLVGTLRDRGTKAVHLMVRPENEPARALYESREFRVVPRLLMTKRLAADED